MMIYRHPNPAGVEYRLPRVEPADVLHPEPADVSHRDAMKLFTFIHRLHLDHEHQI